MSDRDLTGRWDGIFNYPRDLPPTGYVAALVERGGALTGEVEEAGDGSEHGTPLVALVEGEVTQCVLCVVRHRPPVQRTHAETELPRLRGRYYREVCEVDGTIGNSHRIVRSPDRITVDRQLPI